MRVQGGALQKDVELYVYRLPLLYRYKGRLPESRSKSEEAEKAEDGSEESEDWSAGSDDEDD